jgi:FkbH-like protein
VSQKVQTIGRGKWAEVRPEIDRLIAAGEAESARRSLCEFWRREPQSAVAAFVATRFERLRANLGLIPCRVAVLRSFTVEPVVPLLRAAAFTSGLDLQIYVSDFNTYAQEILDEHSPLYTFAPHIAILAVQTRDLCPDVWCNYADLSPAQADTEAARVLEGFRTWIAALREHSECQLLIHNLELPAVPSQGVLDTQSEQSQGDAIQQINRGLRFLAREHTGVYVLDYDALVARYGRDNWHDERKWLTVRMPIASQYLIHLAQEWMRFLCPLNGKVIKALVVDLDNTLWGGVVGEDGAEGIQLGPEYPSVAYLQLQRTLLDLHQRGILLAICSKNNSQDAMEALKHPSMLLRRDHFSALRINWKSKVENLREIAAELNIGLDSVALLDDNPIEREQVRRELPDVVVIELPASPLEYARTLRDSPSLERLSVSVEDRQREAYYRAQRDRDSMQRQYSTREDFYRSLQQEIEIAPVSSATLKRTAQLINKTNQFNLTTRRHNEQELQKLLTSPEMHCFTMRVRDRFGDNGLVGVALTRQNSGAYMIENLLMSCRVIGRTIETALLAFLAEHARKCGASHLRGWYIPSKKNAPARDFYRSHDFTCVAEEEQGSLWSLDLTRSGPQCPPWIRLVTKNGSKG